MQLLTADTALSFVTFFDF